MMADEDRNLVEILEEHNEVDIAKYINYVSAPEAGAIATFSGTTRDTFDGNTVLELRYEAYVPMAIRCMKSICSSARSSWNLVSIAVAHRLGPVPVGKTSVFIAVSSVHRVDSLDACKFIIDEIKASVPIWKKEVYANGEVWKENSEFLNRRLDFERKDGIRNEKDFEAQRHVRKSCCGAKVKVVEEGDSGISKHEAHQDLPSLVPWPLRVRWLNCLYRISKMNFKATHIFREGNKIADALANQGQICEGLLFLYSSNPQIVFCTPHVFRVLYLELMLFVYFSKT